MPHPYPAWLAPETPIYGSNPDNNASPSEGRIPKDVYVFITYPFPERGEHYVDGKVSQIRKVLHPDGVVIIDEAMAGDIYLHTNPKAVCEIYVHREIVKSHVIPPELCEPTYMERLLA